MTTHSSPEVVAISSIQYRAKRTMNTSTLFLGRCCFSDDLAWTPSMTIAGQASSSYTFLPYVSHDRATATCHPSTSTELSSSLLHHHNGANSPLSFSSSFMFDLPFNWCDPQTTWTNLQYLPQRISLKESATGAWAVCRDLHRERLQPWQFRLN